jgi:predicted nucleic acid-binding protein
MTSTIVDSSVLLDVLTEDPAWLSWSAQALADAAETSRLVINVVIFAEVSMRFSRLEDLNIALPPVIEREEVPDEAAFLAGKVHGAYRKRGGVKFSPLPDFFIGAHAAVAGYRLLTRDPIRVRTNFPQVKLITPKPTT